MTQLNQMRAKAEQAEFCAQSCLMGSIGLQELKNRTYELKADLEKEKEHMFSISEVKCADNCAYKMFASEKVMRAYLPNRMAGL